MIKYKRDTAGRQHHSRIPRSNKLRGNLPEPFGLRHFCYTIIIWGCFRILYSTHNVRTTADSVAISNSESGTATVQFDLGLPTLMTNHLRRNSYNERASSTATATATATERESYYSSSFDEKSQKKTRRVITKYNTSFPIPVGYKIFKRDKFRFEKTGNDKSNDDDITNVPVFYNLYTKDQSDYVRVKKIVEEQFNKLLPIHKPIYVNQIGVPHDFNEKGVGRGPLNTTENPVEILGVYETASQMVTLQHLWEYCSEAENENQTVAYLHSKGSYRPIPDNGKLRRFLSAGTLSPQCSSMPEESVCNVCSSRFSAFPHPHAPGNMWTARCSYVRQLRDPETFEEAMDSLGYEDADNDADSDEEDRYWACDGRGKHAADHWILSHPNAKPCDLFKRKQFTWNYEGIPTVKQLRSNLEMAKFPRFELETYIQPKNGMICPMKGVSMSRRIGEYIDLYGPNEQPPWDWWGHRFLLKENDQLWNNFETKWVDLSESARQELIEMGYNKQLWDDGDRPYSLWGKPWKNLDPEHSEVLSETFGFDEKIWNPRVAKELNDAKHIEDSVELFEPNTSFDRCTSAETNRSEIHPWYARRQKPQKRRRNRFERWQQTTRSLKDYVFEYPSKPTDKKRLLVIASVPSDESRLLTLWTELECFAYAVDHVLISAPTWGRKYVERVVKLAKQYIPHFASGKVTVEGKFFLHKRHTTGLWCDAFGGLKAGDQYDEYGMVDDSVFALRKFSGVFDNLRHQNLQVSSLTHSLGEQWNSGTDPKAYRVGSLFRGFDPTGLSIFRKHSCLPEDHPMFCPYETEDDEEMKACTLKHLERDLSKQYACDKIQGLYLMEAPDLLKTSKAWKQTWTKNTRYWRLLVDQMGFPIAKADEQAMVGGWKNLHESKIAWKKAPLLKQCTKHLIHHRKNKKNENGDVDDSRLDKLFEGLDFDNTAKPF